MYLVLFAIGLLATAAGFVTIGFGIPINAFSLGNTLIIAGTTAVAAGLVLIGLAVAVAQLRRIADALYGRPLPRPRPMPADGGDIPPTARLTPVAAPSGLPMAPQPRMSERTEPRFQAAAPGEPSPPPLDWLRPRGNMTPAPVPQMADPAMVEVPDEAPLSPMPPRTSMRPPMTPASEPMLDPKAWAPARSNPMAEAKPPVPRPETVVRQAPPAMPVAEPPKEVVRQAPPAMPVAEPPKEKDKTGLFDVVWPERAAPAPGAAEPPKVEKKKVADATAPVAPPLAPRPRDERPVEKRAEPAPSVVPSTPAPAAKPAAAAERAPTILKSGVIDGMAYTLYADGSIEADLPQGTVKFASVDALRTHLEKNV